MVDKTLENLKEEVIGEKIAKVEPKKEVVSEKPKEVKKEEVAAPKTEKPKVQKPRIIAVLSGKGGVGKTTITANLGASLAYDYNKNVVAVDANTTSAGLGLYLGEYYFKNTINDVVKKGLDLSEAIYCHPSGLKLVPASAGLDDADADPKKMKEAVVMLKEHSDFVLLDCAPTLGHEAQAGIEAADEVLVVVNPEWASLLEAKRTIDYLNSKKKKILGLVINRANGEVDESYIKSVENALNNPILAIIPEDEEVKDAIEKRVPVIHLHPKSEASKNMKALLEKITGTPFPKRKGFWATLVGM